MIAPCTCSHAGQDTLHGKGRRVYNEGKTQATCTVCGAKRPLTAEQMKTKTTKKSK